MTHIRPKAQRGVVYYFSCLRRLIRREGGPGWCDRKRAAAYRISYMYCRLTPDGLSAVTYKYHRITQTGSRHVSRGEPALNGRSTSGLALVMRSVCVSSSPSALSLAPDPELEHAPPLASKARHIRKASCYPVQIDLSLSPPLIRSVPLRRASMSSGTC